MKSKTAPIPKPESEVRLRAQLREARAQISKLRKDELIYRTLTAAFVFKAGGVAFLENNMIKREVAKTSTVNFHHDPAGLCTVLSFKL